MQSDLMTMKFTQTLTTRIRYNMIYGERRLSGVT